MMDLQKFVDSVAAPCAVLSVERTEAGHCGEIRIVRSNHIYKEIMGPAYYDNMLYQELVPQDPKFEDFCFRAAFLKQRMHAYVETVALDCWTDQLMIPMEPENEHLGYCQFLFEFTKTRDSSRMASVSMDTAAAVIKACISLIGAEDFVGSVQSVLQDIMKLSEAYCCRIMLIDHKKREASIFCEVLRNGPGVDPNGKLRDGEIPYEIVNSWEAMIGVSNAVIVKDEQDMAYLAQQNPEWAKSMEDYGVTSLVLIPLRRGRSIVGYLYVVNFNVEKVVEVKELVELMSFFLGSEISNYLLMQRLDELSKIDGLTGIYNRNAMNLRMKHLSGSLAGTPFGIVSLDLNGLKVVNDRDGHTAGDRLLIQAADVLNRVFRKEDLYRTGGDEFVVIAGGISRELFEQKVARLQSVEDTCCSVSFSLGSFWSDGSVNMREAFLQADQNMYADKKAFYLRHPEKKRT